MGVTDSKALAADLADKKPANMRPRDALRHWYTGGLRMPWIEPMTWAYVLFAVFVYAFLSPGWEEACKELKAGWVALVVARNLAVYVLFYQGAHTLLYEGVRKEELASRDVKYNPLYPGSMGKRGEIAGGWAPLGLSLKLILSRRGAELSRIAQHSHDRFWCLNSSVISSLIECYFLHRWASGDLPYLRDGDVFSAGSVALMFFAPFWRTIHFYTVHRITHWSFLYKNVHYLHHRSRNTAPWSGLSMHWVESFLYFTCALSPLVFTSHPVHFLFIKLHADISPIPGHHGYAAYKGQQFHWLHHHYFECNYGSDLVPCDHLFGTYRKDSPEIARVKAKMDARAAGKAA